MDGNEQVSLQSSVKICDDVVSRDLEGEAVILNLETGTYFGLNEVGTRIWTLIQEHESLNRVFEAIRREYEVSPEALHGDLLRMVDELRAKGLVSVL
jgi:hypothetical protein